MQQLRDYLTGLGCPVVQAMMGNEVLAALSAPSFEADLLIVEASPADIPVLVRRAVERRPGLRLLVISSEPEYVNRALVPDPAVAFIEKPFAWRELGSSLERLLSVRVGPGGCGRDPLVAAAG